MHDDDTHTGCGDINRACDSAFALQPHLPKRTIEVLQVRLPKLLHARRLNQFHNALKAGSDIRWEGIERCLGFLIEKSDGPSHGSIIPFLQCFANEGWEGFPGPKIQTLVTPNDGVSVYVVDHFLARLS